MPDTLRKKSNHNYLKMTWENHGVAPAYHHYDLTAATDRIRNQANRLFLI